MFFPPILCKQPWPLKPLVWKFSVQKEKLGSCRFQIEPFCRHGTPWKETSTSLRFLHTSRITPQPFCKPNPWVWSVGAGTSDYPALGILQGSELRIQRRLNPELQADKGILFVPLLLWGRRCTRQQGWLHNNGLSSPPRTRGSLLTWSSWGRRRRMVNIWNQLSK